MRRIFILLLLLSSAALAQKPSEDDAFLDAMSTVRNFQAVAISPDGAKVAWAERRGGISVGKTDGTPPRHLTIGDEEFLAWSPDSNSLAYVGGTGALKQLYVVQGADQARQITNVNGFIAEPQWSPDGTSIAFLFIENAQRAAGPLVA